MLDVKLDPACEVVKDLDALLPSLGFVTRGSGVIPERVIVVDRPDVLAEIFLGHLLQDDSTAQQDLDESGTLLL